MQAPTPLNKSPAEGSEALIRIYLVEQTSLYSIYLNELFLIVSWGNDLNVVLCAGCGILGSVLGLPPEAAQKSTDPFLFFRDVTDCLETCHERLVASASLCRKPQ